MKVVTLDEDALTAACKTLMERVERDGFSPDALIGVKTGGWLVSQKMNALYPSLPIASLTCQRPSTKSKKKLKLKAFLQHLPYFITDKLRIFEHNRLEGQFEKSRSEVSYRTVSQDNLGDILPSLAPNKPLRILVVDDAVDSGETLNTVSKYLEHRFPLGSEVRYGTITTTFKNPRKRPDYSLYEGVLCRFHWSDDF